MPEQDRLWREEANAWYARNKQALSYDRTGYTDPALTLAWSYALSAHHILDVGASNGWRLAHLCRYYAAEGQGVDVASEAIADGRRLYPELTLHEAPATALPVVDGWADLCVVAFLLHCLSRTSLLLAASEIDRCLAPGGYLLLSDFAPDYPSKRPWKHRQGLVTWKLPMAGAGLFLSTGGYRLVAASSYDHDDGGRLDAATPSDRRAAVVLLRKEDTYLCKE